MTHALQTITENTRRLLDTIPAGVTVVAAVKSRSTEEVLAAGQGGIRCIGHNYIQEALRQRREMPPETGEALEWHFIGHLQRNKAAQALQTFDMLETIDNTSLAGELERRLSAGSVRLPVLIEINSAREANKSGVLPEDALELIRALAPLPHLQVQGLMTMGPFSEDANILRPYFRQTRQLFEEVSSRDIAGVSMNVLSMGMSDSYEIAIEEGATMIRIGTRLFGPRLPQ